LTRVVSQFGRRYVVIDACSPSLHAALTLWEWLWRLSGNQSNRTIAHTVFFLFCKCRNGGAPPRLQAYCGLMPIGLMSSPISCSLRTVREALSGVPPKGSDGSKQRLKNPWGPQSALVLRPQAVARDIRGGNVERTANPPQVVNSYPGGDTRLVERRQVRQCRRSLEGG